MTRPQRIDVHHHILPDFYLEALAAVGITDAGNVAFPAWSPDSAIATMDRCGIATAITSIASPGVYFGDAAAARRLARQCNEYAARLVSDRPARFGGFAQLPLPDVDGALAEIAYAFDTLKLDGVVLLASIGERYLGDPAFDAVFAELNRRKAVVFVHPTIPVSSRQIGLSVPAAMLEFVFDTTRAATNLIYSGTLERYQDLSIILSHAGGTVPYISSRIDMGKLYPALAEKAPQGAIAYLKRLYYDTAMSTSPTQLASLRELVDPSQIVYGSDYPFFPEPHIQETAQGLAEFAGFRHADRVAIEHGNALALFPRLRALR